MGNKVSNKKEKKATPDLVETYLTNAYRNTDLEFTYKEMINFKLRIHDAEKYFHCKFDYFLFFNNLLFRDKISILYDNFSKNIEKYPNKQNENFSVLIEFDEELEENLVNNKIDFDPLFMIIFEKLELNILFFLDMTNVDLSYISEFFEQLFESVDLYKYNRKFDCLYFLLPNTDYIIKNDCGFLYVTYRKITSKKLYSNSETNDLVNDYTTEIFSNKGMKYLLKTAYTKTEANYYIEYFFERIKATVVKLFMRFNFLCNSETLIINNEDQFKMLEMLIHICPVNIIVIDEMYLADHNVLEFFIKKIVNLLEKSSLERNVLVLKIYYNKSEKKNKELDIKMLRKMIKNIIYNFYFYEEFKNKRKFIIEFYQYTLINASNLVSTDNGTGQTNSGQEINLKYEKLYYYWYLNNKKIKLDFKYIFGVLLRKYQKLNNNRILSNIKDFVLSNFKNEYVEETSTINLDSLFNF